MLSKWLVLSLLMMASTLKAEHLMTHSNGREYCATSYKYNEWGNLVYVGLSRTGLTHTFNSSDVSFITGYIWNEADSTCSLRPELIATGMNYEDYNYLMALSGLLTGFSFLFLGSYLVILIARK